MGPHIDQIKLITLILLYESPILKYTVFFYKPPPYKGPFKKYVIGLGGEGGSSKIVTKCDKGGGGSSKRVMSPLKKNIVSTITLE